MKACSLSPISSASCISSLAIASHASVSLGSENAEYVPSSAYASVCGSSSLRAIWSASRVSRAPFGNRVIAQGTREACEQHRP